MENYIDNLTFEETCDVRRAKWLLNNLDKVPFRVLDDYTYDPIDKIKTYLNQLIKGDGLISVSYKRPKGKSFGRYFSNKYGCQQLLKEFRHTLFSDNYYDLDIVNCHPVLLEQYCKKNNIVCKNLSTYVNNRDTIVKRLVEGYKITSDEVKETFIKIIYGGSIPPILADENFLINFNNEVFRITADIVKLNPNIESYVAKHKTSNIFGSTVANFLQDLENSVLTCALKFMIKNCFKVDVLVFDGCMIRKTKEINQSHLDGLSNEVLQATGYLTKWVVKPMDQGYNISESELSVYPKDIIIENDKEGALILLDTITKGRLIIKTRDGRWFKKKFGGIFEELKNDRTVKLALNQIILDSNLKQVIQVAGGTKVIHYSSGSSGMDSLYRVLVSLIPEDDTNFVQNMWNSNVGKLCFKNGVLNFRTGEFTLWENDTTTLSPIYINYDYSPVRDENVKWIYDNVLDPIFYNNVETRNCFLEWASRGVAGDYTDKTWAVSTGARDCGKGCLSKLFYTTLGDYYTEFNAENLFCIKACEDPAKKLHWLVDLEFKRLFISNEVKTVDEKGRDLKIDASQVKSISSGGDLKKARKLHCNEIAFRLQGRMMLMMNDVPMVSHQDALETLWTFEFQSKFVKELTDKQIGVNEMEDGKFKYLQANDNIKTLMDTPKVGLAFIHILLDYYKDTLIRPNFIKEAVADIMETEIDVNAILHELFEFTLNKNDKILVKDVNDLLISHKVKKTLVRNPFKEIGVYQSKSGSSRYWNGLKVKSNNLLLPID